jgi:hypothetical protein
MRRLAVLAPTALLLAAAPATADEQVVVSVSDTGVFDAAVRWVPGDARTESFLVRNEGPSPALVSLQAFEEGSGSLAADVRITARRDDGTWRTIGNAPVGLGETRLLVGEATPIVVRAAYDPASTSRSQARSLDLTFVVTLTGDQAPATEDNEALPDTGNPASVPLVLLAAGLVGVGTGLMAGTRRRQRKEQA